MEVYIILCVCLMIAIAHTILSFYDYHNGQPLWNRSVETGQSYALFAFHIMVVTLNSMNLLDKKSSIAWMTIPMIVIIITLIYRLAIVMKRRNYIKHLKSKGYHFIDHNRVLVGGHVFKIEEDEVNHSFYLKIV